MVIMWYEQFRDFELNCGNGGNGGNLLCVVEVVPQALYDRPSQTPYHCNQFLVRILEG